MRLHLGPPQILHGLFRDDRFDGQVLKPQVTVRDGQCRSEFWILISQDLCSNGPAGPPVRRYDRSVA
jgi:hypothetical protein